MEIIVQKYGGTSLGTTDKIRGVAKKLVSRKKDDNQIVVVVSAMGDTTDELIKMAYLLSNSPDRRELDALMSTGEMVSASLLAIAIKDLGQDAVSLSAYQLPISTTGIHGKSLISSVDDKRITEAMKRGSIVVIAGFQGIDEYGDITTLGRGGSDTTAVALAAKLGGICEIYTDVDGIYTVDPRLYPDAKKLDEISFEEMLELASLGAQVMHSRAVELGEKYGIPIYVAHSSMDMKGTFIREVSAMESKPITGLAVSDSDIIVTLQNLHFSTNKLSDIFENIAEQKIGVDMISQTAPINGSISISFTIPKEELQSCRKVLQNMVPPSCISVDEDITKFSVVGIGMRSTSGVASRLFKLLSQNDIQVKMVTTSEIRITCAINRKDKLKAITIVAKEFGL